MGASNEKQLMENIMAVELKDKMNGEIDEALGVIFK